MSKSTNFIFTFFIFANMTCANDCNTQSRKTDKPKSLTNRRNLADLPKKYRMRAGESKKIDSAPKGFKLRVLRSASSDDHAIGSPYLCRISLSAIRSVAGGRRPFVALWYTRPAYRVDSAVMLFSETTETKGSWVEQRWEPNRGRREI